LLLLSSTCKYLNEFKWAWCSACNCYPFTTINGRA
jgi:hypothetical protein